MPPVSDSDFAALSVRVDGLESTMRSVEVVQEDVEELVKGFRDVQAGFRVLAWLGKAATPILWLIGVATGVLALFKTGGGK
jgi:hypothetical protein